MFVVDQVVDVGSPIGFATVGHFLTSLTDFISEEHPWSPRYLNIRGLISAYKFREWLPGIIELSYSGYEIEWYSSSSTVFILTIAKCVAKRCILAK